MKIYTRAGDDGSTGLLGNVRVRKDIPRLEVTGAVDELNAQIGLIVAHLPPSASDARAWLDKIQSDLFILGAQLATPPSDPKRRAVLPLDRVVDLERRIDAMEEILSPLNHFILPQGVPAAAFAHAARATARRAERRLVGLAAQERVDKDALPYLNRLSDFLFVLARWMNVQGAGTEIGWTYSETDGATLSQGASAAKDRMDVTLKKLDQEKEGRKTLFEKAAAEQARKKEQAERLFKQSVEKAKTEGPGQKPIRDLDLD